MHNRFRPRPAAIAAALALGAALPAAFPARAENTAARWMEESDAARNPGSDTLEASACGCPDEIEILAAIALLAPAALPPLAGPDETCVCETICGDSSFTLVPGVLEEIAAASESAPTSRYALEEGER